jgi:hypothetical protein
MKHPGTARSFQAVPSHQEGELMSDADIDIWLGEDGILRVRFPRDFGLTLDFLERLHQQRLQLIDRVCPLLVYADSVASAEFDAQQFASRQDVAALISGMAIIVKSVFTRAMSDVFMRFHRPPYPTRIFREEGAALEWLRQFVARENGPSGTGQGS